MLVGDRGMLTDARIRAELEPVAGPVVDQRVTRARDPALGGAGDDPAIVVRRRGSGRGHLAGLSRRAAGGVPQPAAGRGAGPEAPGAARRHRDGAREDRAGHAAPEAAPARRGQDRPRVGKVLNKYKVGKHFELTITDDAFRSARKQEQITTEAALDGLYVVRTDVGAAQLSTEEVVRAYKSLSGVERAFRTMKTIDLKVRPSTIAVRTGCARTSSSACWPTTWSGTCAAPWRRCSLRTTTEPTPRAPRWCARPSAPRRPPARPPPSAPRTTSPPRASAASGQLGTIVKNWVRPSRPLARPSRWSRPQPAPAAGARAARALPPAVATNATGRIARKPNYAKALHASWCGNFRLGLTQGPAAVAGSPLTGNHCQVAP